MIGLFFPRARKSMISMLYQDRLQIPNRMVPVCPSYIVSGGRSAGPQHRLRLGATTGAWPTTGGPILDPEVDDFMDFFLLHEL